MKKLTFAAVALLTATAAIAQETAPLSAVSVQGDFGYAHHRAGSDEDHESGQAFAPGIALSYQITPNWSARLQYTDVGELTLLTAKNTDIVQGIRVSYNRDLDSAARWMGLTAQYQTEQIAQQWSFGARIGASFWKQELTVTDTITAVSRPEVGHLVGDSFTEQGSDSGVGLLAGVFAQYHFTQQLALTFDLDLAPFTSNAAKEVPMFADFEETELDYHVSRVAVGLQYRF